MTITRQWIGGGDNSATDPNDWSPTGLPQPGDTLYMFGGTMDIASGDLAGDRLMAGGARPTPRSTINLSGHASLNLETIYEGGDVNVQGSPHLDLYAIQTDTTVNIAAHSVLHGTVIATFSGRVTIDGPGIFAAEGDNTGSLTGDGLIVNADVIGNATFDASGSIVFGGSVGAGIAASISQPSATITIDQPREFHAAITDTTDSFYAGGLEHIDLLGLAASSYDYKNDMLHLYSGNTVVDTLRLHTPYGLTVTEDASGVTVWTGGNARTAGSAVPQQTLPQHVAGAIPGW